MPTDIHPPLKSGRVLLCVTGGIAAYKAAEVLRDLTESGCEVTVIATDAALSFVGAATWAALSGKPVATSMWQSTHEVPHISLARWADIVAVVPATADALARIADGRANDLVSAACLMTQKPVVLFPAMHTEMWDHPQTREHVSHLRDRGFIVVTPDAGRLTGADSGVGRLADPRSIAMVVRQMMLGGSSHSLSGKHVVVSAGGTRESIDDVRVISNRSSGLMGYACAAAAVAAGAQVTVLAANVSLPPIAGTHTLTVESHQDLAQALDATIAQGDVDVVVMAAAVSDYTPAGQSGKIKKSGQPLSLELQELPDLLAGLAADRVGTRPLLVGFAAETAADPTRLIELAGDKRQRKGCDVIVANDVSGGAVFGSGATDICIIDAAGHQALGPTSKEHAAAAIIATVARLLS